MSIVSTLLMKLEPILFARSHSPESLPPNLVMHSIFIYNVPIIRHPLWRQAHLSYPEIPNLEDMGWEVKEYSITNINVTDTSA